MATVTFADADAAVGALYTEMAAHDLQPLWLLHDLLDSPPPRGCVAHRWPGQLLRTIGERAGELIGFDRGGDRRVLALCNPGLGGRPYATPTLWAAVQYLAPGEVAPPHRHSPAALRFVLGGDGVVTAVDGDAVPMAAGDLVLTPSWTWHEHHNDGKEPMLWLDVLDLPLVEALDAVFFEPGTPDRRAASPGDAPSPVWRAGVGLAPTDRPWPRRHSPVLRFPWDGTDRALSAVDGAHATVRFTNPVDGGDVLPTMRCEMHRVRAVSRPRRRTGSSVWTVFHGAGTARVGEVDIELAVGDVFVVPSAASLVIDPATSLDLFSVSDAPVLERLGLADDRFYDNATEDDQ